MDNAKVQNQILQKLRAECAGTGLFKIASTEYGCSLSYLSRVLSGKANYNPELINVLSRLLMAYKEEQTQHLTELKESLGY